MAELVIRTVNGARTISKDYIGGARMEEGLHAGERRLALSRELAAVPLSEIKALLRFCKDEDLA